jgi:hypothetical protein
MSMPTPRQPDPPSRIYLLTCPNCIKPMRIKAVEVGYGKEQVTLVCDECEVEPTQDKLL